MKKNNDSHNKSHSRLSKCNDQSVSRLLNFFSLTGNCYTWNIACNQIYTYRFDVCSLHYSENGCIGNRIHIAHIGTANGMKFTSEENWVLLIETLKRLDKEIYPQMVHSLIFWAFKTFDNLLIWIIEFVANVKIRWIENVVVHQARIWHK